MKIRQKVGDFIVKESAKLKFSNNKGAYSYFVMNKINRNTLDVIEEIAVKIGCRIKDIGFCGNKDKRAITEQYISIPTKCLARFKNFRKLNLDGAVLEFIGCGNDRLYLGANTGNWFEICVRDLSKDDVVSAVRKINAFKKNGFYFVNYFDEQRFGRTNVEVGRALVKKDFVGACRFLGLYVNRNDYVNALRDYGIKKLKFCVHAYQAYLWNRIAVALCERNIKSLHKESLYKRLSKIPKNKKLQILGFLSSAAAVRLYKAIMEDEGIKKEDFLIKQIVELSCEGNKRKLFAAAKKFSYEVCDDEVNKGKNKILLKFELDKGSYGSIVAKLIFGA